MSSVHQSISSVQNLVTYGNKQVTSIPSPYACFKNPSDDSTALPGDGIPVIIYSLLISEDPDQQTKTVSDLGNASSDWGSFMVKNHGISEKLYEEMFDRCAEFNSMSEDEKQEFKMKKDVMDRIMFGSSINISLTRQRFCRRDYLKLFVHPDFNSPQKPAGFSEKLLEISRKQRQVMKKLLSGVSKSLQVEESYLYNIAEMDRGMDLCVTNMYPPCPQPQLAVGLSPHTDFGLLSILTDNGSIAGLHLQRNGTWFNVNIPPNYLMVNLGDHMEILTDGKYKSAVHRAMVNNKTTRISLVTFYGSEVNNFVVPIPKFVDNDNNPPAYRGGPESHHKGIGFG